MGLTKTVNAPVEFCRCCRLALALPLHWFAWLLAGFAFTAAATEVKSPPGTKTVTLEIFVRAGCSHCAKARIYVEELARQQPELRVVYRSLDAESQARDDLARYCQTAGVWPPGVPAFVADGRLIMLGFDSADASGPQLRALLRQVVLSPGRVESRWLGTLSAQRLGLPLFTLALGLLDGFNPCAMWVLLFLLALLVRLHDRARMALIAGVFVLASGAVYYAFMAAWLNAFLWLGVSQALRVGLALVAMLVGWINLRDGLVQSDHARLAIPESAKPGIYARIRRILQADALAASLIGVVMLAVAVNFFELLCTAGLPALYTATLVQHNLNAWQYYAYLGLYNLAYIADDTIIVVIAVVALGHRRLNAYAGRWLKLLSGAVMLVLGIIMLLRPDWLS